MLVNTWQWKPLQATNAPEILDLISRIEEADDASIRTSRAEVESYFHDSHVWRAEGAWVGSDLIAFGLARTIVGNTGEYPITVSGGVAPEWRDHGVGKDLLERQVLTARSVANSLGIVDAEVQMYVESSQHTLIDLAYELGFTTSSQFIQMRRNLDLPINSADTSGYLQIVKLSSDWMRDTRKAHNMVLAGSTSWTKLDAEAWEERIAGMEEDWCLVALDMFGDRPRLAGYLLASRFSSDVAESDGKLIYDEGYVEEITVLPEWRGKRVASALITTVMERFRASGLTYIGLDVNIDADGEGADLATVFEHFGFEQVSEIYIMRTSV